MQPIDLARFHQAFFEESFEGLDIMEAALLRLSPGSADRETIDAVFRAAHSIKGGSGTFGFTGIASFTHVLEALLDRVRAGERALGEREIDLTLRAVDLTRAMLRAAAGGPAVDPQGVAGLREALQQALDEDAETPAAAPVAAPEANPTAAAPVADAAPAADPEATDPAAPPAGWQIRFRPAPSLFATGNDPLRLLRDLADLGRLTVTVDDAALPPLAEADPARCYLAWDIELQGEVRERAVREVFAWVEDDCSLQLRPLTPDALPAAEPPPSATPLPEDTAAEAAVPPGAAAEARPALQLHEGGRSTVEGNSIRVSIEKIDALINLVGELVITQAMLQQQSRELDPVVHERLLQGLAVLDRNTRLLQEAVMATRMLPVDAVFSRFPRLVRDLAAKLGKQVRLQLVGLETELDKSVIERVVDPLTHLVRNAIDHGIERSEIREAAGKDPVATLTLRAAHQGGHIVIEVIDDGRGLDRAAILAKAAERGLAIAPDAPDAEVWALVFAPGFSTVSEVTDLSGRGVGMDVVKQNIQSLGGQVELFSEPGRGVRVLIRLPLTLAILDGMSVRVGEDIFILPLNAVVESLLPKPDQLKTVANQLQLIRVRNDYLPLLPLDEVLRLPKVHRDPQAGIVVLLEAEGRKVAVLVDELVGQQQVVIKSLETHYQRVPGVSGATILGDGRVALIIDAAELVRRQPRSAAAA